MKNNKAKQSCLLIFVNNQMNVNVINQIREEVKQFNSLEEFDLYLHKHKDEMNNKTTQYLNKVYKIQLPDGTEYRITKKNCLKKDGKLVQGDIYLKRVVANKNQDTDINELMYANIQADITNLRNEVQSCIACRTEFDSTKNQLADLVKQIKVINELIAVIPEIKNSLNEVIRVINSVQ